MAAVALLLVAVPGASQGNPDSLTQPLEDGCQRDPAQLLAGTSPQWVYVGRDPEPHLVVGTAVEARPTYTDLFRVHDSYDMNIMLRPDQEYWDYLGTANLGENLEFDLPSQIMEVEWEQRAYSLFAWATWRDRVEIMGSWIWDCGHWGQGFDDPGYFVPGTAPGEPDVTGEHTEIHPPRMVVVHRFLPVTSDRGDSVTDVLISSEGTIAKGVQDRAAGLCDEAQAADCPQWVPVNDRDYQFSIRAPPRPQGATEIVWSIVDQGSDNGPGAVINVTDTGVDVLIPFAGWGTTGDRMVYAQSIHVGWDVPRPVQHLRLSLQSLEWLAELDGPHPGICDVPLPCTGEPQTSQAPDEVNVYVDVAGQWRQLDIPGLAAVGPGDLFELDEVFDVYVGADAPWRVYGMARECDQPFILECSADEAGLNDDAGIFNITFSGPVVNGTFVGEGMSSHCEAAAAGPCYKLTFAVEDLGQLNTPKPVVLPPPEPENETEDAPMPEKDTAALGPVVAILALGVVAVALNRRQGT